MTEKTKRAQEILDQLEGPPSRFVLRYHTLDGWTISARWGMSADDRFGPINRPLLDEALLEICVQMELAEEENDMTDKELG